MAQDSLQKMVQNRNTIRRIMAMDSGGQMNKLLENAKTSGRVVYDNDGGVTYNKPVQQDVPMKSSEGSLVVNEETMKAHPKMAKAILESFRENPGTPIDMPKSVLDGLGLERLDEIRQETEQIKMEPMTKMGNGGGVDYSLIRTIVNEAVQENVKKYMSALSKKLISEGVVAGGGSSVQALKIGDKFSFITENGDVYEATLEWKTNLNSQKKTTSKKKS